MAEDFLVPSRPWRHTLALTRSQFAKTDPLRSPSKGAMLSPFSYHLRGRDGGRDVSLNQIRTVLYTVAKFLGDLNAIEKGRLAQRLARRIVGNLTGRFLGRLFR